MPSRTRPPARRFWSLAPRLRRLHDRCRSKAALSAFARTGVFHRDGRGRRQDAGRRAHDRAGDREAENPETPPCEGGLSVRVNRDRLIADRSHQRRRATLASERLTADAAPLSNASGSAPRGRDSSRLGRCSRDVKTIFYKISAGEESGANPSLPRARAFTHLLAESLPPPPCGEDRLGRRPSEKGGAGHEAPDRRGTQSPSAAGAGPGGLLRFAPAADGRRAGFDRQSYARRPPPRSAFGRVGPPPQGGGELRAGFV